MIGDPDGFFNTPEDVKTWTVLPAIGEGELEGNTATEPPVALVFWD